MIRYLTAPNMLMLALASPVASGVFRFKRLDIAARVYFFLCLANFLIEAIAYNEVQTKHSNLPTYNIGSLLLAFLTCLYFNYAIEDWRKIYTGYIVGAFSVFVGVVNLCFLQSLQQITSYFLFYQGLLIIWMTTLLVKGFFRIGDTRLLLKNIHFWLALILLLSSGIPYLFYFVIDFYANTFKTVVEPLFSTLYLVNIISALSIAVIFLLYPKMQKDVR